mmetsp:Transcript_63132/g.195440  ORF Transcript_63132/g.195440 Transcript_63132/m.195440 type:complete len:86 (+) Transcript_63132:2-259(+)
MDPFGSFSRAFASICMGALNPCRAAGTGRDIGPHGGQATAHSFACLPPLLADGLTAALCALTQTLALGNVFRRAGRPLKGLADAP